MFSRGRDVGSGSFDAVDSDSIQRTASSSSLALSSNFGGKTKDQLIAMLKVRKRVVYSGWDGGALIVYEAPHASYVTLVYNAEFGGQVASK